MATCNRCGGSGCRENGNGLCAACKAFLGKKPEHKLHPSQAKERTTTLHSRERLRDRSVSLGASVLGFSNAKSAGDYVMQRAIKNEEFRARHGAVKHWRRNENGELVQVS